jgi:hypothetical protein
VSQVKSAVGGEQGIFNQPNFMTKVKCLSKSVLVENTYVRHKNAESEDGQEKQLYRSLKSLENPYSPRHPATCTALAAP